MNYETLVMGTCAVVAGTAEARSLTEHKTVIAKPIVAAFGLGIFLFVFGMVNERIGKLFCLLVIVTAVLVNGGPLITALTPKPTKK